jgi:hypothetical protein
MELFLMTTRIKVNKANRAPIKEVFHLGKEMRMPHIMTIDRETHPKDPPKSANSTNPDRATHAPDKAIMKK